MANKPFRWTIHETPAFVNAAGKIWSDEDRESIIDDLATRAPDGDDLIPASDGCYKTRERAKSYGKRNARIIYWVDNKNQRIFILNAYIKSKTSTIPGLALAKVVARLRQYPRKIPGKTN